MIDRIKRFLGLEMKSTLANPSPELLALFGAIQGTAAGKAVTASTALRSPTTLACVRAISETVGELPIHLFRRQADSARERDTSHPVASFLAVDPNPWTGFTALRTALQVDALVNKYGGFALVIRAGGRVREMHRLDPSAVTIECDDLTGEPRYRVRRKSGGDQIFTYRDVLHIATPGAAFDRPLCMVDLLAEAIALDLAMAEHQGRLFGSGARPSGILEYGKALSPDSLKRLKASFDAQHGGPGNSGKTLVLEDGMTWKQVQFNSVDLQFLELRRFAVEEIARGFKVPGTLIGDLNRATWRNVEELNRQYLTHTILPWLDIWQSALSRVLLSEQERADYFLEFITDDLLRGDITARFGALAQAVGAPWMTPNEARAVENRAPVEGGDELIRQAGQAGAAGAGGAPGKDVPPAPSDEERLAA